MCGSAPAARAVDRPVGTPHSGSPTLLLLCLRACRWSAPSCRHASTLTEALRRTHLRPQRDAHNCRQLVHTRLHALERLAIGVKVQLLCGIGLHADAAAAGAGLRRGKCAGGACMAGRRQRRGREWIRPGSWQTHRCSRCSGCYCHVPSSRRSPPQRLHAPDRAAPCSRGFCSAARPAHCALSPHRMRCTQSLSARGCKAGAGGVTQGHHMHHPYPLPP